MSKALDIANNLSEFDGLSPAIDLSDVTATNANLTNLNIASTNHTFTVKGIDAAITDSQSGTSPDVSDADSGQLAIYNGATKLWGINEDGWIQNPNKPYFWAYTSGSNFSAPTTYQNFPFNNLMENAQGMYDLSTQKATAPIDGLYEFIFWTNVYNASGYRMYQKLTKNGTDGVNGNIGYIGNNSDTSYSMSHVYRLSAGDYVEAFWSIGAGTVSNALAYNGFLGYLIG